MNTQIQGIGNEKKGCLIDVRFTKEEDDDMLKFLFESIHNRKTGQIEPGKVDPNVEGFWKEFKQKTGSERSLRGLKKRYCRLAASMRTLEMETEKKLKLCFGLRIPLQEEFLEELREEAVVEVEKNGCITMYRSHDDGLSLRQHEDFNKEEKDAVWKFVLDRADRGKRCVRTESVKFWNEFKEATGSQRDTASLITGFRDKLLPNVHLLGFETEKVLKLYSVFGVPIDKEVLRALKKEALIFLDTSGAISSYSMRKTGTVGALEVESMQRFTQKEEDSMWMFILRKIRNPMSGVAEKMRESYKTFSLWEEFKREYKWNKDPRKYMKRFSLVMAPHIHLTQFLTQTKVELYYGLGVPVNEEFLETLKETADIEMDEDGCIVRYEQRRERGMSLGENRTSRHKTSIKRMKAVDSVGAKKKKSDEGSEHTSESSEEDCSYPRPRACTPCNDDGTKLTIEQQLEMKRMRKEQKEKEELEKTEELKRSIKEVRTSGRKFLIELRDTIRQVASTEFSSFLKIVDVEIENLRDKDRMIPIHIVQSIIDTSSTIALSCKSMADSFGPNGWFKWSEVNLSKDAISWIEEDSMWMFLFTRIHNPSTGRVEKGRINPLSSFFWEQYRIELNSQRPLAKLKDHFENVMSPNLHVSKMTGETKLKFYFALDIPVDEEFLKRLLDNRALVILNEKRCISRYRQNTPGGLELNSPNVPLCMSKKKKSLSIIGQEHIVWLYLLQKIHNPNTGEVRGGVPTRDLQFWKLFKEEKNCVETVTSLMLHFHQSMAPFLHLTKFTTREKVKLYFALEIPVHQSFLKCLEKTAVVEVDAKRRILKYEEMNTEGLKLSELHNMSDVMSAASKVPFTQREELEMWKFVYEKIRDPRTKKILTDLIPWESRQMWEEFKTKKSARRYPSIYQRHFKNVLVPGLRTMKLDRRMKVSLYFALRLPVDPEFLETLKMEADVELHENGSILVYKEKKKDQFSMNAEREVIDIAAEEAESIGRLPEKTRLTRGLHTV